MHENVLAAIVAIAFCIGMYLFAAVVRWVNR